MLAGHLDPDEGEVYFQGEIMEGPEIRLVPGYEEIKLVHQQYDLGPNLTLRGNLNAALTGYTSEYRSERVDYLIDFFRLREFEGHYPRGLSGGQQQRLAIAMAMSTEPEVLLMDEPFSALDPMNAALCLAEVRRLARETNTAVLLVTHDVRDAMIADKMIVLIDGEMKQEGTPKSIYDNPLNFDIASLLGPINKLSPAMAKKLGLENEGQAIRIENIRAKQRDSRGFEIKELMYRGAHQVLMVEISPKKLLYVLDGQKQFQVGDRISLDIDKESVLRMSES